MSEISKTQIDRLGDRLRKGSFGEADLRLLDEYRRSFTDAYEFVVGSIRKDLALQPTGRPAKSTSSISEKLRRESIRLTQIQDIAGCRLIVSDTSEQDLVAQALSKLFKDSTVVDRRQNPSHGYRAVHVIARCFDKLVEIQIRSSLQHLWAELSEKLSDTVDPALKYGGGNQSFLDLLGKTSELVATEESVESEFAGTHKSLISLLSQDNLTSEKQQALANVRREIDRLQKSLILNRQQTLKVLRDAIDNLPVLVRESDDISN